MIMKEIIKLLQKKGIKLPGDVEELLLTSGSVRVFDTVQQLADASTGDAGTNSFEVKYEIPGKGEYTEAIVHRVTNGI